MDGSTPGFVWYAAVKCQVVFFYIKYVIYQKKKKVPILPFPDSGSWLFHLKLQSTCHQHTHALPFHCRRLSGIYRLLFSTLTDLPLERAPKIIPAICTPHFAGLLSRIRLSQPATTPSSGTKVPQTVTHILQKAFFKHALALLTVMGVAIVTDGFAV